MKGIINLRGSIISVIDTRARLKKSEVKYDERTCIIISAIGDLTTGFIVDNVDEVINVDWDSIIAPPESSIDSTKVTFDTKALAEIQKQSSGNISITIVPNAKLSSAAKSMIGTRPVYDLMVNYSKEGKNATVASFGGGTATVSVPYPPPRAKQSAACMRSMWTQRATPPASQAPLTTPTVAA